MTEDARTTVRSLLAAAGIAPPAAEVEAMIQGYPALRAAADALFADEVARHDPVFLPTDAGSEGDAAERTRAAGAAGATGATGATKATGATRADRATRPTGGAVADATTNALPGTIEEAGRALRSGRLSSVELTRRLQARADALDAKLGTFIARFDESALAAARRADADFAAGIDRGPLQGIPLGVKDIIAAREGATTACSQVLDPDWGRGQDAPVVARLRAQGAVVLGKTTTLEFAMGPPDPEGPFPLHRNPWDLERWPGGSSSGTGSGVAAGLMLGGLGSDTGGSIRIPAALCGISGLKPTFGLVPRAGVVPLAHSLDTVGPMARSARDCATILQAIVGPSPDDPTTRARPAVDYAAALTGELAGLTVGVERAHHSRLAGFDPACRDRFEAAVADLERAGARIVEVRFDGHPLVSTAGLVTSGAEAFAWHRNDLRTRHADYGRGARHALAMGAFYGSADYVQAQKARAFGLATLRRVLADCDVLVMPTMGLPAPRLDADFWEMMQWTFTPAWNLLGAPALSVPMGPIGGGLPSSLQIVGGLFDDATVLRVGDAYQQATDWHRAWPSGPRAVAAP
ncbi:MAG: amidase [Myxococcota bacterium]